MNLIPVKSSQISAIGYDEPSKTLRVQFSSGSTYDYNEVPASVHTSLMEAESVGKYFGANIKGVYSFRKLAAGETSSQPKTAGFSGGNVKVPDALLTPAVIVPEKFEITPSSLSLKTELLNRSNTITVCDSAEKADALAASARDLRTYIASIHEMGLALRRPLKAKMDEIKKAEDDYIDALQAEQNRLESLYTGFAEAEKERVRQAEASRKAEVERLESERREAARKAEEARLKAEQEAADAQAKIEEAAKNVQDEAQLQAALKLEEERKAAAAKAVEEAQEAQRKAAAAVNAANVAIMKPTPAAHKTSGLNTKDVVKWEVADEDLLYWGHPELFTKPEIKKSAVNAICFPKAKTCTEGAPDTESFPGLTLWWAVEAVTRKR